MRRTLFSLLLTPLLLSGCGSNMLNPVTGQTERSVMSEESELVEGQKAHQQVLQDYGVVPNPKLQAYVNQLGQRLAKLSHRDQLQWHFTVLDSPEINAFALPGGYVYVTRGIMAYLGSEADLAGVLGHEIGHVTARHGAQRATRQQDAGLGLLAASVLGAVLESQGMAGAGQAVNQVSQTVASGLIASYGREQELQADGLGAEYLARNAYDPRIMIKVIKVLQDQERFAADQARAEGRPVPAPSNWLASHPSNDQRLQTITELAGQYPAKSRDSYADEGRARYLQAISGMDFGDSAAQGVTRGRNFYHAALGIAITAPPGWKIQNEATQLMLVNAARDAALVMKTAPAPAGKSQDEIIRALLKPSQGRSERLTLNGLPATHFVGARTNAQGQTLTLEATLVSGPAQALFLLNYSARDATALQRARPQLQEAQNSFRPLTASEQAAARAWTLKTVPYPRGGFAELARSSPLEQAEPQLRLINGFYGGGVPQTGQLVKTIATP